MKKKEVIPSSLSSLLSQTTSHPDPQTKKLNEQQWDHLVDHLHRSNKMKESALMKEQNQGLALELNGLSFKPAMNPTSLVLASTMKSLKDRLPGMATKKEAALAKRREEVKHVSSPPPATLQSCNHPSERNGGVHLRSEQRRRQDLREIPRQDGPIHRHPGGLLSLPQGMPPSLSPAHLSTKEKLRRNDQRKKIIDEIESRELTFQPQLNPKSKKIQVPPLPPL
jgi:hypothetical protein